MVVRVKPVYIAECLLEYWLLVLFSVTKIPIIYATVPQLFIESRVCTQSAWHTEHTINCHRY